MTTVADVAGAMERIAPLAGAWSDDNVGLLVGDPRAIVARVLLAIDLTNDVVAEAVAERCELVVAYHPPLFGKVRALLASHPVHAAIRAGLAVYSPHTALDAADGGTADVLADAVGMGANRGQGALHRVGDVPVVSRQKLVARVKAALGVNVVLVAGPLDGDVTRVGVAAGSAGEILPAIIAAGAQAFVTGELRHHDALAAARAGLTVICALHSNSERLALAPLATRLRGAVPGVTFALSAADRDPFVIA